MQQSYAVTRVVSKNQALPTHYTTIQAAINASVAGDTVLVWPGTYFEQVNLNKNIILMGSGQENTIIAGNFRPSIVMSTGTLQWFRVSSQSGDGISLTGGVVQNCVIMSCAWSGISLQSGVASVTNCVSIYNGSYGIYQGSNGTLVVTNTIARWNAGMGFYKQAGGTLNLSYSNGGRFSTSNNTELIDIDPGFVAFPGDLHIAQDPAKGWNVGSPALSDPDGSRSDIGYFGGPNCPTFPVVSNMTMTVTGGTVQINVTGRANY